MPANRTALFQKSTRRNEEFERFLCDGQEATILDATTSKYIPLSYFVTPHADADAARRTHGLADKMPYESYRLINLQQRGNHAHSLVIFKSRAITTNPEQIAIFECNGQVSQSEIRILHTSLPPKEYLEESDTPSETSGTVYDVTELYFSPVSPRICMNFGNDAHNPGYCGIFGIIAMVFYRQRRTDPETWVSEWSNLLIYMRRYIPEQPRSHGCMGTELAARVQEILASHPSTHMGHQKTEQEINHLLNEVLQNI
jgi:hypothetical protein